MNYLTTRFSSLSWGQHLYSIASSMKTVQWESRSVQWSIRLFSGLEINHMSTGIRKLHLYCPNLYNVFLSLQNKIGSFWYFGFDLLTCHIICFPIPDLHTEETATAISTLKPKYILFLRAAMSFFLSLAVPVDPLVTDVAVKISVLVSSMFHRYFCLRGINPSEYRLMLNPGGHTAVSSLTQMHADMRPLWMWSQSREGNAKFKYKF